MLQELVVYLLAVVKLLLNLRLLSLPGMLDLRYVVANPGDFLLRVCLEPFDAE